MGKTLQGFHRRRSRAAAQALGVLGMQWPRQKSLELSVKWAGSPGSRIQQSQLETSRLILFYSDLWVVQLVAASGSGSETGEQTLYSGQQENTGQQTFVPMGLSVVRHPPDFLTPTWSWH